MEKVFVYGTLLKGFGNNHLLDDSKFLGNDTVLGSLWEVSVFPGFHSAGDKEIHGEVWEVNRHTLERLDRLEGFLSENNPHNMYNRIKVKTIKHVEDVWIYEWNMNLAEIISYKYNEILTGNYRLHTGNKI